MLTSKLLEKQTAIIKRYPLPTYVRGELVQGSPSDVTVKCIIVPTDFKTVTKFFPDRAEEQRVVSFYTHTEVRSKKNENGVYQQADRFFYEGEEYEVLMSIRFNTGVLDHYEVFAAVMDR